MSIRNAVRAIVVKNNKILLNKCKSEADNCVYYILPGGGQNIYESMEEAVVREIKEETGWSVKALRIVALGELIFTDKNYREEHPNYSHRLFVYFICELASDIRENASELDFEQEGSVWVDINEVDNLNFESALTEGKLVEIINSKEILNLGTVYK